MKAIALIFLLAAGSALAVDSAPDMKVSTRRFPDGKMGSQKTIDKENHLAIEAFFLEGDPAKPLKLNYRIMYTLNDDLDPISAVYLNAAGRMFQKSTYKLGDPNVKTVKSGSRTRTVREPARIEQEVVYDAYDRFICTKSYVYGAGSRSGNDTVMRIEFYDINGRPLWSPRKNPDVTQPVAPIPRR